MTLLKVESRSVCSDANLTFASQSWWKNLFWPKQVDFPTVCLASVEQMPQSSLLLSFTKMFFKMFWSRDAQRPAEILQTALSASTFMHPQEQKNFDTQMNKTVCTMFSKLCKQSLWCISQSSALNSKEWPIHDKLLELFLRLVLWKQTENDFFLLVLTVRPVRHQLCKHCT